MAISFGTSSFGAGPKDDDVVALIAAKKYARAVEILKAQLQKRGANPSLRMQLADVLILAGKKSEAVALLLPLADQYATDGFATKAVSVLKKIQKVDPGRSDVQARLARLIEEKQKEAVVLPLTRSGVSANTSSPGVPPGDSMDGGPVLEIGFSMAPISVSAPTPAEPIAPQKPKPVAVPPPRPEPRPEPKPPAAPATGFALLDSEPRPAVQPPASIPRRRPSPADTLPALPEGRPFVRAEAAPPPGPTRPEPGTDQGLGWLESAPAAGARRTNASGPNLLTLGNDDPGLSLEPPALEQDLVLEGEPIPDLEPLPVERAGTDALGLDLGLSAASAPDEAPRHSLGAGDIGIEDNDLLYLGEEEDGDADLQPDAGVLAAIDDLAPADELSDGQFADELMSLVDTMFQEAPAAPAAAAPARKTGTQIVVSPLFRNFSVDEMVAVIEGLKLLSFERGEVILREGDAGSSLYTLTAGRVRAFRKDPAGSKQLPVGDLKEGAFFGELSVLTGAPRTATVVALTRCELLELDRPTLDEITKTHPHVWDVLREFASTRSARR